MLGISFPLIQGGLAYLARARLAAAVSNAGGLGQITAVTLGTKEALVEEIREFRRLSKKPFAVNIALGRLDVSPFIEAAIEEEVPAVTLTAGNPEHVLSKLEGTPVKVLVLVSSPKQAKKAETLGVDAVIAVGHGKGEDTVARRHRINRVGSRDCKSSHNPCRGLRRVYDRFTNRGCIGYGSTRSRNGNSLCSN